MASAEQIDAFIERWGPTGGGERSNYQLFLTELCALLFRRRVNSGARRFLQRPLSQ